MHLRRARALASPLLALLLLAVSSSAAWATDYTVTKTADTYDGVCNADCSLREAIIAANSNPGADKIILGNAQLYTLNLGVADPPGALIPESGDLDIKTAGLTIEGNGSTVTAAPGFDRVFDILGIFTVTINNLTIQGGVAKGFLSLGGGLYIRVAAVILNNSAVNNNSTALENSAQDSGGGIAVIGEYKPGPNTVTLASLTLNNSIVANNSGLNGGGVICVLCTLTINNNSAIRGNAASGGDGGGIAVVGNASTLSMTGSRFVQNAASGAGGALSVPFGTSTSTLSRNKIASNTGPTGSAIFNNLGAITATNNWWGCNYGPGNGGAGCASATNGVSGTVVTSPHLVLKASASPAPIAPTTSSTAMADMTFNSSNVDTSPGGTLPNGMNVPFAGTLGTFATPTAPTTNGKATDVYTAGAAFGTASLTATMDGQTASTSVLITCLPITLSSTAFPPGWAGVTYPPTTLTQSGGVGTTTFAVTGGGLPPGLTLSGAGTVSGTATATGTFTFTVTATDANGCTGARAYALAIGNRAQLLYPAVSKPLPGAIATFAWDSGQVNVQYSLWIGNTPGGTDIYAANDSGLMRTVAGLPADGRLLYVRLYSRAGNVWGFHDYVFQAASGPGTFDTGVTLVPGDYDGDGKTDYAAWIGEPGLWYIQQSSTNYATWLNFSWGRLDLGHRPVPADYDGDGKTDPAVWEGGSGMWYILKSSTSYQQQLALQWGNVAQGHRPLPGDYDGDGKADPAVWEEGTGMWYALKSSTNYSQYLGLQWGLLSQGHRPVPEDYDGDGKTDPAVWEERSGMWYMLRSSSNYSQYLSAHLGSLDQGHRLVPADYDGDGKTDPAVWEETTGMWYILRSASNYQQLAQQWGSFAQGDQPVPADYSGDGKAEPAVWRASTGIWYFLHGWSP